MGIPAGPTLLDLKDDLEITETDTSKDGLLTRLLFGAFDYVERRTRREFSTGVGTRYFDGNDKGYLLIDDFQKGSMTKISFLDPNRTVYLTMTPTNTPYLTKGERPQDPFHNRVDITNYQTENPYRVVGRSPYIFPRGTQNIAIDANWGTWAELPQGLQNLIIDIVKRKYRVPVGVRSMSVGGESLSFSDEDLDRDQRVNLNQYIKSIVDIFPD